MTDILISCAMFGSQMMSVTLDSVVAVLCDVVTTDELLPSLFILEVFFNSEAHKHHYQHSTASTTSNAHNDISPNTMHFLGGWSNTTYTQSPTPESLTAVLPGHASQTSV